MSKEAMKIEAGWRDPKPLEGATLHAVHFGEHVGNDAVFLATDHGVFMFTHNQDCCEHVRLESLTGWSGTGGLVGLAEERTESKEDEGNWESQTATFYTIRTTGDDIDMRWIGESNGFYSESVDVSLVAGVPADAALVTADLVEGSTQ